MTPRMELGAIDTLFKLQREYRSTRDGRFAFVAFKLAHRCGFGIPPWVLAFLDDAAAGIVSSNGDHAKIAKAVQVSPTGPHIKNDNDRVAHAFGFIPGDFDMSYDDAMFRRRETLLRQVKSRAKSKKTKKRMVTQ